MSNAVSHLPPNPLDVVAHHVIAYLCDYVAENWENFPDISEDDWFEVACLVGDLTPWPDADVYADVYAEAYAVLAARVDHGVERYGL